MAHFNRDPDPSCSFCSLEKLFPAPLESFSHLFFDCKFVNNVVRTFCEKYFTIEVTRSNFFAGNTEIRGSDSMIFNLVLDALRYSIWETKLLKRKISFNTIELETTRLLEHITKSSAKINQQINMCNFINVDGNRRPQLGPPP